MNIFVQSIEPDAQQADCRSMFGLFFHERGIMVGRLLLHVEQRGGDRGALGLWVAFIGDARQGGHGRHRQLGRKALRPPVML